MKKIYYLLFLVLILIDTTSAQHKSAPIRFKNGDFLGNRNLIKGKLSKEIINRIRFAKNYYALLQFASTPGITEKKELIARKVVLFDYVPHNAFMAEIPESFKLAELKDYNISGVYRVSSQFKIAGKLLEHINEHSFNADKLIAVSFFGTLSRETVENELRKLGAQIMSTKIKPERTVFINTSAEVVKQIASLPFVAYISEQVIKDVPLNYNNHAIHALDALDAGSGRNLQGNNVAIGLGDNGDPSTHIDFAGRLFQRNPTPPAAHATHTMGTAGGGGILNPMYKGMAPQSTLISQNYSDILVNTPTYVTDYNMVLTSNSYYSGNAGCSGEGEYDVFANFADVQLNLYDSLLHVFAAGNDGALTCTPYPLSYGTIKSGYQCAKNVLTVGAMDNMSYAIASFSSGGPVNDGRIKPEIVAGGVNITSTYPYNNYGVDNGTSMSSPTVAGTIALLYERYRQLHNGANPSGALLKAVTCNGADDLGNPGPDYLFGFGMLNARTAVEAIENNAYFTGTLTNGGSSGFVINSVPAGALQIKVMLYWNDPAAAAYAATALVNNLDLTVTASDGVTHHPLILNPNPGNVNDNAVEGVDTLNNIEQVVIYNPPGGNINVNVNGTNIPSGPQNFVVAYEIINPSVTVEYPYGNETWVPGQTEYIRWSAYGGSGNGFTLAYSLNNGTTWTTINNNISDSARSYAWTVPDTATNNALIRVTRNNLGYTGISKYGFTILGQPSVSLNNACQGYVQALWNSIPGATNYQVMVLSLDTMRSIATTNDTSYLISGLNRDSSYWFTVRAMYNNSPGIRALAGNIIPSGGPCTINSKDFSVDSLISPLTGRQFTSTQLSNNTPIKIELKNLGNTVSSNPFTISYQVNGGNIVTESSSAIIASDSAYDYTFGTSYDFSMPGTYNTMIWVDYPGDTLHQNDTLNVVIKQLANDTLSLNPSFTEGFETAAAASYTSRTIGFIGLDRCDFNMSNSNGRARTFVNTGFARTGDRCATLDQVTSSANSTADSLLTTFNLSNCAPTDQIWLNFYYKNQGIDFSLPGNQVWIRGNDQAAWIPVLTLPITGASIGVYQPSGGIDVSGTLAGASPAQSLSSSFQILFGEQGYTSANSVIPDGDLDDGYSFDDITFTKSSHDVGMVRLVSPNLSSICNLTNAESIQVKVRNYSMDTLSNIAVSYSINGTTVTENIPTLGPKDSLIYTFAHTADLSAYQNYNLNTWVSYPLDNYHLNDSLLNINFQTTPIISTYPYLEGFENNDGYWYTNGVNDSWQWGTPQKTIINKAANGSKAWVTSLTGDYNNNELSYLYSPCFDLSSLSKPVLSFSHIFQTEDDCDCDYHWAEYSLDDSNWVKLGAVGGGTNWYDDSVKQAWQLSYTIWHVSSYDIPVTASKVRFRIVMSSDPATTYEGVGIDDVHVFDKASVYKGPNLDSGITQNLSGTNWINFMVDTSIVAAINPNGQNLGNTTIKAFINTSGVRHTLSQYYLDRNLVIQPANQPTDSVSVRFYFLDSEADSLINATGCGTCTTIYDAYESGITQYSKAPAEEDSTLNNNIHGVYQYILPHSHVSIIPNDNGYYAEYKVAGFSEFWINGGGSTFDQPLGLFLQTFTATLQDTSGLLQWSTLHEINIDSFIVQKSSDSINFSSIGIVLANGDTSSVSNYQFIDNDLLKGMNYYRLKIINEDGSFQYSPVRSIDFIQNPQGLAIYPNPIPPGNILHINTASNCNSLQLSDVIGRIIKIQNTSGFQNTLTMDNLSRGVYMLVLFTDSGKKVAKIIVE
jgi:hypothetical protein